MVLRPANIDLDEFPARECVASLIVLRIEPLALLPLAGSPHSMHVGVAVRGSWALARIREAWIQVTYHGGVHRVDFIRLFVRWTQRMAVFAPAAAHVAYFGCRVGCSVNARRGSQAYKAYIANPGYLEQNPNRHPIVFVAFNTGFCLCRVFPLHRSDRGHVILEATSRR